MKRIDAPAQTWESLASGRTSSHRESVTCASSLVDGRPASSVGDWQELDLSRAWVDGGPSPAGNVGPYLKVPRPGEGTVHRVYARSGWRIGDNVAVDFAGRSRLMARVVGIRLDRVDRPPQGVDRLNDECWTRVLDLEPVDEAARQ